MAKLLEPEELSKILHLPKREPNPIDDQIARMKVGIEAEAQWADVACRIADAVEHTALIQAMANLAMMGYEPTENPPVKHRADCPACQMVRTARKVNLVQAPPNGWNRS